MYPAGVTKDLQYMEIPGYIVKSVYTHYKRIVENATCDATDARRDIAALGRYIENNKTKRT